MAIQTFGTTAAKTAVRYASLVVAVVTVSGCGGATTGKSPVAAPSAAPSRSSGTSTAAARPVDASDQLVGEIDRELAAMRVTSYKHATHVDEASGTFIYDCSGMLDYALGRVLPTDAAALPTSTSPRPLAGDIENYLHRGLSGHISGWRELTRVDELRPGDVIAWLATEDSKTGDTGHVMVVRAEPARNSARAGEYLVPIADSTLNPHALDSRHPGQTGLGTGTIGLVADDRGEPTAFYWQGGVSPRAKPTQIALGRPL